MHAIFKVLLAVQEIAKCLDKIIRSKSNTFENFNWRIVCCKCSFTLQAYCSQLFKFEIWKSTLVQKWNRSGFFRPDLKFQNLRRLTGRSIGF